METVEPQDFDVALQSELEFLESQKGVNFTIYPIRYKDTLLEFLEEAKDPVPGGEVKIGYIENILMNRTFASAGLRSDYYIPDSEAQKKIDELPNHETYGLENKNLALRWENLVLLLGQKGGDFLKEINVPAIEKACDVSEQKREEEKDRIQNDTFKDKFNVKGGEILEEKQEEFTEEVLDDAINYAEFRQDKVKSERQELSEEIEQKKEDIKELRERKEQILGELRDIQNRLSVIQNENNVNHKSLENYKGLASLFPEAYIRFSFDGQDVAGYTNRVVITHENCKYPLGFFKVVVGPSQRGGFSIFRVTTNQTTTFFTPHVNGPNGICLGGYDVGIRKLARSDEYVEMFPFLWQLLNQYGTGHALNDISRFKCVCHDNINPVSFEDAIEEIYQ